MRTRALVIGAVTVAALVAGGWAWAHSEGSPGGGAGRHFKRGGESHGEMGPGMHGMGPGMMHGRQGPGMGKDMGNGMGNGMGPMHGRGAAFADPETDTPTPSPGTAE